MNEWTVGEFCAGIGGFGLGFEQAGWRTVWQIELDDVNRALLADRFPDARQHRNLLDWRSFGLPKVRCICFGSPCQDISVMSSSKRDWSGNGLKGGRSGLFFAIMEAIAELKGVSCGLDATNLEQAYAAGNAVPPPIAKWIAEILMRS